MGKEKVSLKVKELRRENLALKAKIRRQQEKLNEEGNLRTSRSEYKFYFVICALYDST